MKIVTIKNSAVTMLVGTACPIPSYYIGAERSRRIGMGSYLVMFLVQTFIGFAGMCVWYRIGFLKGRNKHI